jgi:hypothetical protein
MLRNLPEEIDLSGLIETFPPHTKLMFTMRKDQTMTVEACTVEMLKAAILAEFKKDLRGFDATKADCKIEFFEERFLEMEVEMNVIAQDSIIDFDFTFAEPTVEVLYYSLNPRVAKMHLDIDGDQISIQASRAFPEYGINAIGESKEVPVLDAGDLAAVCELLESGDADKIATALAALKTHPGSQDACEKRYLNLLKVRLDNESATLDDFVAGMLSKAETRILESDQIAPSFISFSYYDDSESKVVVDAIGSITRNHVDLEAFVKEASQAPDEKSLLAVNERYATNLKNGIREEARLCPDGWFSKFCTQLGDMILEKVMFEKTDFETANVSLALPAFMFFAGQSSRGSVYFDIHQSTAPELTEIFWLLPKVPQTNWSDVKPQIPKSPLSFTREAKMKTGDFASWEQIANP